MKIKLLLISLCGLLLSACDSSDSTTSIPQANEPPALLAAPKAPLC